MSNPNYTRLHGAQLHIRLPFAMKADLDEYARKRNRKTAVLLRELIEVLLDDEDTGLNRVKGEVASQRVSELVQPLDGNEYGNL